MKILGFYFDNSPSAVCHVAEVINKFYGKLWTLRFLRSSGMGKDDLLKVYKTVIRPAVEYCSSVYHSLIPKYMSDKLERVQFQAMKIVFGHHLDYSTLIDMGKIETLESRRISACLRFASKAANPERFGNKWFPQNNVTRAVRSTTR